MEHKSSYNVGIASFGLSGKVFHAPLIENHPYLNLHTIVEKSRNEAALAYPNAKVIRTFEELVNSREIDIVVINTPDDTHYLFAKEALLAGKNVIVEKPFVQKSAQGEELIQLANKKNLLLSVYQNRRWDGDFMTVQQIIKNNMLGRLIEFESNFMRYRNFIVQNTWKEGAGRGITVDLGSHMIDQALVLFGKPTGVIADIDAIRDNSAIDDYYNIRLIYPNVKVTLKASILVREQTPRYTLHGTLGSFLKYGIDPQEERLKKNPIVTSDLGKESEEYWGIINTDINNLHVRGKVETIDGCYMTYYNQIYDTLCGKSTIPVSAEDGLLVIKVAEAALKSATSGHIEVI